MTQPDTSTSGDATHEWFTWKELNPECCRLCGVVRRADRQNQPCKGLILMRPLEKSLGGQANMIDEKPFDEAWSTFGKYPRNMVQLQNFVATYEAACLAAQGREEVSEGDAGRVILAPLEDEMYCQQEPSAYRASQMVLQALRAAGYRIVKGEM